MARTQIPTRQIGDQQVTRPDLNVDVVGEAVAAKIIAGTNVTITETGADPGTGDVTINAIPKVKLQYYSNQTVLDSSVRFLRHGANANISHNVVPIVLEASHTMVGISMATNIADNDTDYEVALYRNMRDTPILVGPLLTYSRGAEYSTWNSLNIAMTNSGEYGIGVYRTAGGTGGSSFNRIIVILSLEVS